MAEIRDIGIRETGKRRPIVALALYGANQARLVDGLVDLILVGDSMAMTLYGHEHTRGISLETMIAHGRAVVGQVRESVVVMDMPYAALSEDVEMVLRNARRLLEETGAHAVKIEGRDPSIGYLVDKGVPVMGHIGLLPQSVEGSYRVQGRESADAQAIVADAKALAAAGCFAMVVEAVLEKVAAKVTAATSCPTIGIGAGGQCDGQILVLDDLLGLTVRSPKFARRYTDGAEALQAAVRRYGEDVRAGTFPGRDEVYA